MIKEDKLLHFFTFAAGAFIISMLIDKEIALWSMLWLGVLKELYDLIIKKTYFDFYDIVADIWGIMVGLLFNSLIAL